MAFEVYKARCGAPRLEPGECALVSSGEIRFTVEDADYADINGRATILIDDGGPTLALRCPREDEPDDITVKAARAPHSRRCCVRGALTALGIDVSTVTGRYAMFRKDRMLLVDLGQRN